MERAETKQVASIGRFFPLRWSRAPRSTKKLRLWTSRASAKSWPCLSPGSSADSGSGLVLQAPVILPMFTGSTPSNSISRTTRMSRHINSWPLVNRTNLTLFCHSAISSSVASRVFPALPCNLMAGACSNRPRTNDFSQYHRLLFTARTHSFGFTSRLLGRQLGNSSK